MKGKKKTTVLILGAFCSIALLGGSVFAMENKWLKDGKEPIVSANGEGEPYSREESADRLRITLEADKIGMTLEEFERWVKTYEFPLTDSAKISGKVENGVHPEISNETDGGKEPTVSAHGDGESYSREELAKKLGITLEEFDEQVRTYEFPLTGSTTISGKVENDVHLP